MNWLKVSPLWKIIATRFLACVPKALAGCYPAYHVEKATCGIRRRFCWLYGWILRGIFLISPEKKEEEFCNRCWWLNWKDYIPNYKLKKYTLIVCIYVSCGATKARIFYLCKSFFFFNNRNYWKSLLTWSSLAICMNTCHFRSTFFWVWMR